MKLLIEFDNFDDREIVTALDNVKPAIDGALGMVLGGHVDAKLTPLPGGTNPGAGSGYYERKAQHIRDHCLSHPWTDDEQQRLVVMLKEIAKDQRHACASAVVGVPHRDVDSMNAIDAHSATMNAEIEE